MKSKKGVKHRDNVAVRIAPRAAELRTGGMKLKEIAFRLQVGQSTVERALRMTGAKLPADRFWCGHPKEPDNFYYHRTDGKPSCRLCHNSSALRSWHRKQGKTLCRLAQFWAPSRESTDHRSRITDHAL